MHFFLQDSCGCGTWSLTSGEEHRLKVFEKRVLGAIFGSKSGGSGRRFGKKYCIMTN
jgi:hypothetical protein